MPHGMAQARQWKYGARQDALRLNGWRYVLCAYLGLDMMDFLFPCGKRLDYPRTGDCDA